MYWNYLVLLYQQHSFGLTLTWDVLKLLSFSYSLIYCVWLTLTWDVLKLKYGVRKPNVKKRININMRCIEMYSSKIKAYVWKGLTLTWDVLKCYFPRPQWFSNLRLTLTWDVLKYIQMYMVFVLYPININMRCIEMQYWLA